MDRSGELDRRLARTLSEVSELRVELGLDLPAVQPQPPQPSWGGASSWAAARAQQKRQTVRRPSCPLRPTAPTWRPSAPTRPRPPAVPAAATAPAGGGAVPAPRQQGGGVLRWRSHDYSTPPKHRRRAVRTTTPGGLHELVRYMAVPARDGSRRRPLTTPAEEAIAAELREVQAAIEAELAGIDTYSSLPVT
jgi:hypothetical protein